MRSTNFSRESSKCTQSLTEQVHQQLAEYMDLSVELLRKRTSKDATNGSSDRRCFDVKPIFR
ncbi:hypothetical protein QJS10_CPB04g00455 [Acorus calamus]|uniref:Uncharacterized protein n=1 Tax=Acorus calamus TaxID=4465 RepID=A0AAV9EXW1_ACOCL|nr:hypothetical protein QJS10_CPB04g00455 [Acorus calamus]